MTCKPNKPEPDLRYATSAQEGVPSVLITPAPGTRQLGTTLKPRTHQDYPNWPIPNHVPCPASPFQWKPQKRPWPKPRGIISIFFFLESLPCPLMTTSDWPSHQKVQNKPNANCWGQAELTHRQSINYQLPPKHLDWSENSDTQQEHSRLLPRQDKLRKPSRRERYLRGQWSQALVHLRITQTRDVKLDPDIKWPKLLRQSKILNRDWKQDDDKK